MRKEVNPPVLIGIISITVVILIVVGYFVFRGPGGSGDIPPDAAAHLKDAASHGKMGGDDSLRGLPMPGGVPGQRTPGGPK